MKYTITKIEGSNTWVTFSHDDGTTSDQTIANLPVGDKEALELALVQYEAAYIAGKEVEKGLEAKVAPDVEAVVGEERNIN